MNATDQVEFLDTHGHGEPSQSYTVTTSSDRGEIWFAYMGLIRGWPPAPPRSRAIPDMISFLHYASRDVDADGDIVFSLESLTRSLNRRTIPPVARSVGLAQSFGYLERVAVDGTFYGWPRNDQRIHYHLKDWSSLPTWIEILMTRPDHLAAYSYDRRAYLREALATLRVEGRT